MASPADAAIRIRVAVLVRNADSILLVRHEKDGRSYWLLPGGGLEYGETLADAAVREAREEMNLDLTIGDLVLVWESLPPNLSRHVLNLAFEAQVSVDATIKVPRGDDRLREARYIHRDELSSLTMHPPLNEHLRRWLDDQPIALHLGTLWSEA
jgi:8-oxo-dGTP diphosphatase